MNIFVEKLSTINKSVFVLLYVIFSFVAMFVMTNNVTYAAPRCMISMGGSVPGLCSPGLGGVDYNSNKCYELSTGLSTSASERDCSSGVFASNAGSQETIDHVSSTDAGHTPSGDRNLSASDFQNNTYSSSNSSGDFFGDCRIDRSAGEQLNSQNCGIVRYVVVFTQALSALVGIVVVIMIVWGGIKYTSAKDNPQQAAEAKEIIRNAIIALVAYFLIFAVLQWLVPGGVIGGSG